MKERLIELTDGSRLSVKVNFGTMYHLTMCGGSELAKKIEKKQKKNHRLSDKEQMEFAGKIVYAMLRSNGREATFDEALMLMPTDLDEMKKVIDAYEAEVEKLKKKQESKQKMKKFVQK